MAAENILDKIEVAFISDSQKFASKAQCVSPYTLALLPGDVPNLPSMPAFDDCIAQISSDNSIHLGPGRLLLDGSSDSKERYLIVTQEVHDFAALLGSGEEGVLQIGHMNLNMRLQHKDEIKPEFRNYTASLTYDLHAYQTLFDALDSKIKAEPIPVQKSLQLSIMDSDGKDFLKYFDKRLAELERIVVNYSRKEHEKHGFYFRRQVWPYVLASPMLRRTNMKPRGYSGDSEMMRMIYEQRALGETTFSKLMHLHPVNHAGAQAVRARRKLVSSALTDFRKGRSIDANERLRILSIACGPAFEIRDIIVDKTIAESHDFTFMDQDPLALGEATETVNELQQSLGVAISANYQQASVRTMLRGKNVSKNWGEFGFIYSMGLFDYLIPPVAKAVFKNLYDLLLPGGKLIIGNFHASNPSRTYMEYWVDWVLFYRTEEEMEALGAACNPADIKVEFEKTGSQMFLHVIKGT